MTSLDTCTSSRPRAIAGLLTVFVLAGCGLGSIDPDEIDIADDEVGETETGDEGFETGDANDEAGTGDTGEAATDDTDADDTSDTDGTDTNDMDGTGSTTDTGDDTTTGNGQCEAFGDVGLGENDVAVEDGVSSFEGTCGGTGAETLYSFMALADGDHQFSLVGAEFDGILYLLDESCAEIADSCSNSGDPIIKSMLAGEIVLVAVDSNGGIGTATLVITGP